MSSVRVTPSHVQHWVIVWSHIELKDEGETDLNMEKWEIKTCCKHLLICILICHGYYTIQISTAQMIRKWLQLCQMPVTARSNKPHVSGAISWGSLLHMWLLGPFYNYNHSLKFLVLITIYLLKGFWSGKTAQNMARFSKVFRWLIDQYRKKNLQLDTTNSLFLCCGNGLQFPNVGLFLYIWLKPLT